MTFVLSLIVVIGLVVFVHELGHFLAAKAVGIRVERFSIGFPPKIVGKKFGDTEYCLSWIPLGGYVKMSGMIDESMDGETAITGAPWEFQSKPTWAKTLAITGGVLMNFLFAFLIYTFVIGVRGIGEAGPSIIGEIQPGYPAEAAGLQVKDEVVEIDGALISTWDELVESIHAKPERSVQLKIRRGEEIFDVELTPKRGTIPIGEDMVDVGLIGVSPDLMYRSASFGEAITAGYQSTIGAFRLVFLSIRLLVSGQASVRDLSGPIGIAKMSAQAAKSGILSLLAFVAFISINIGFLNILPIPALDGGHLIVVLWEGITRKVISTKVKLIIQQVGVVIILALMVLIIVNDLTK
ncbi:MAG: RIP metalloprotease RseP [Candidatus Eisenbacteria bacterium]|uniref:Zinc metalloprotease n=1 Tax=Eiseniibacteriota bacterium TaxID=2212470 RepID=A0A948RUV5_UNCEI|nr:RIP metalloprotease RseP [Candidatus Eisenbacteria bacterium]MBU1950548.1 RIP metalloprotease RseP [Candidatus Eisenbacteria bacterium]MBU2690966.1 RIP metalloprotease RseP [Candidatus Eisenbacteria bacterium]